MPTKANKKANTSTSPGTKTEKTENTENVEKTDKVEEETKSGHKRQREVSHDKVFFVEKILDKKKFYGVWRYKVKWQGFSEEECTWEPAKNLESVKDMLIEFNKNFVPRDDEEEKTEKSATTKDKPSKTKSTASKTKSKEEDTGKAKKFEKKEKKTRMGSPIKKVKTDKLQDIKKVDCGHFKLGDHPKQIATAKKEHSKIVFTIEWKQREDGNVPSNTKMSNVELRNYDKDLLLDFYEARLKFVKPSAKESEAKSANKAMEEERESKQGSPDDESSPDNEDQASETVENGPTGKQSAGKKEQTNKQSKGKDKEEETKDKGEEQDKSDTYSAEENKKENQLVETAPGEKQHTSEDVEHEIDDYDQPVYADLNFNMAEDLRVETYAPTMIVETQPMDDVDKLGEKEVLTLESPQEISDDQSDRNLTID